MLNKNRKGVSEVVANVLIVLLVIVGIAVIWSVVKPTVDKGAQGIKTGSECLSLSLEVVSCDYNTASTASTAVIKRNPGSGIVESVDIVFEGADGTSKVYNSGSALVAGFAELSTISVSAPVANVGGITGTGVTANVAARTGGQVCPPLSVPVVCT